MGKYMALWEVVQSTIPIDPKERGDAWSMLMAMTLIRWQKSSTKPPSGGDNPL